MLALLCALALSQHANADPELAVELAEAEGRLDGLEYAVEQRAVELQLVTAQASRLVELLAAELDGPAAVLVVAAENSDLDTGAKVQPEAEAEPDNEEPNQ